MWKIRFIYGDGGKITLTNKRSALSEELYDKYMLLYGRLSDKALYQQYPKKNYNEVDLKQNPDLSFLDKMKRIEKTGK
ncbi:MAG: hypothetical protein K0R00_95 [Herbinix sp.]|jgi:hypothetical protein|nr:hypothetical protein [Herbinix sp.]